MVTSGVYFCNCGTAVADKIDSAKIRGRSGGRWRWVHSAAPRAALFGEGKQFLEDDLRENGVERAVICACSPRDHEQTFMRCMARRAATPTSCRW